MKAQRESISSASTLSVTSVLDGSLSFIAKSCGYFNCVFNFLQNIKSVYCLKCGEAVDSFQNYWFGAAYNLSLRTFLENETCRFIQNEY